MLENTFLLYKFLLKEVRKGCGGSPPSLGGPVQGAQAGKLLGTPSLGGSGVLVTRAIVRRRVERTSKRLKWSLLEKDGRGLKGEGQQGLRPVNGVRDWIPVCLPGRTRSMEGRPED